jgi:hypothetical protein
MMQMVMMMMNGDDDDDGDDNDDKVMMTMMILVMMIIMMIISTFQKAAIPSSLPITATVPLIPVFNDTYIYTYMYLCRGGKGCFQ